MLYDPKWDKTETKADPWSLASLIAWLEKQPHDTAYNFDLVHQCLACKYFQSLGYPEPWTNSLTVARDGYITPFGSAENYRSIAMALPWTCGAALKRARAIANG